jgi:membrane protease subunit HflK
MKSIFGGKGKFPFDREGGSDDRDVIDLKDLKVPKPNWKALAGIVAVGVLALLIWTSFYKVDPEEVGIVLRLGRYVGSEAQPGLHIKIPFGVDKVYLVPVQRQLKQEFGFRTAEAGVRTRYSQKGFEDESLMLTMDLNAAVVEWIVQFRIVDPYKYLFRVRNIGETFRDMTEAVMREVVGDRTVNEVLTIGRQEVADQVAVLLQELLDQYETGITIDQVVLQDVNPPDPVKPSFNEVNEAQQEREKLINQARAEYNQIIPRARGEAQQTIQRAEGYAIDRINRSEGEATRFIALYDEYRKAPEVTRRRLYLETLGEILPGTERKIILDEGAQGILPLLDLREAPKP